MFGIETDKIYSYFNNTLNKGNVSTPNFRGLRCSNLAPLRKDTVSFGNADKINDNDRCRYSHANRLAGTILNDNNLQDLAKIYEDFLVNTFKQKYSIKNEIYTNSCGKNLKGELIIAPLKTKSSLADKIVARGNINTIEHVKANITDIIRARLVLKRSGAKQIEDVLQDLQQTLTKRKQYKSKISVKEIKILNNDKYYQYPQNCKAENHFPDAVILPRNTESGYCGVHIIFQLQPGYSAELQIIGKNVAKLKEVEDILYKLNGNKNKGNYPEQEKAYITLKQNKDLEEVLKDYTKRAYEQAHKKDLEGGTLDEFLSLRDYYDKYYKEYKPKNGFTKPSLEDFIPDCLDLNNLAKLVSSKK